jgi:dephospho-CoA kinase
LTGGIGTGKSYVRAKLDKLGVPTIDADSLAREAVDPGTATFTAVVEHFGSAVVGADGSLNRRALGKIVFADPKARQKLERIVHPAVRAAMEEWFGSLDPMHHPIAVADVPLLFETGRQAEFDEVILTVSSPSIQFQRLRIRDGLSEAELRERIAAQLPVEAKLPGANFVIDTSGTFAETDAQIESMVRNW